jgi:hypothetical protein
VIVTRAQWGSWNEWLFARHNKGPLLEGLARTRPDLAQALAREDKEDRVAVKLVAAELAKEAAPKVASKLWSAANLRTVKEMREKDTPATWDQVCHLPSRCFLRHFSHPTCAQIGVAVGRTGPAHKRELARIASEEAQANSARQAKERQAAREPGGSGSAPKRQRVASTSVRLPSLVPLPLRPASHLAWCNAVRAGIAGGSAGPASRGR